MAEQPAAERTEQPTAKRRRDARERGQVARSKELETTAVLLAGAGTLLVVGPALVGWAAELMRGSLAMDPQQLLDERVLTATLRRDALAALLVVLGLTPAIVIAALLSPMLVGGLVFSTKALSLDFSRLDPLAGLRRIFALRGLVELVKALAKFVGVGAVAALMLYGMLPEFMRLGLQDVRVGMSQGVSMLLLCLLVLSASLGLIALLDVPFQLWDYTRGLRMTREEVREELKETEGRPEVRSRLRQLAQERARRRMMHAVPKADVVIVNPTHYAVALVYASPRMRAPRVVAKGSHLIAARIREVAEEHGVPVFECAPLARALHFATDIGDEIPAGLYAAVARVLAWVYRTRTAKDEGTARPPAPVITAEELSLER